MATSPPLVGSVDMARWSSFWEGDGGDVRTVDIQSTIGALSGKYPSHVNNGAKMAQNRTKSLLQ